MDIVEKVARAICKEWFLGSERTWQNFLPAARAAIEAMREPTPEMVKAAKESAHYADDSLPFRDVFCAITKPQSTPLSTQCQRNSEMADTQLYEFVVLLRTKWTRTTLGTAAKVSADGTLLILDGEDIASAYSPGEWGNVERFPAPQRGSA